MDDEEGELAHQWAPLDVGHELGRRDQAAVRKHAPDERLCGVGCARRELEDRLVEDEELVPLECGLDVANDTRVDATTKQHRLVARIALRRIHLAVRTCEELFGSRAVVREHRPSDASVDLDRRAVDTERPAQRVPQPSDERAGAVVASGDDREDDELVAADASNRVRLADDRLEAAREGLQHDVAGSVTPDVVDVLEAVEIDDDERERLARTARSAECLLDAVVEEGAVGKIGEWVAKRFGMSSPEPPVEHDTRRGRDEGADDENRDHVVDRLPEDRREQARDEHECRQAKCPHERASQLPPPVLDRHFRRSAPLEGCRSYIRQ